MAMSKNIACPRCGEVKLIEHRNTTTAGKRIYNCMSETCRAVRSKGRGFIIFENGMTYPRTPAKTYKIVNNHQKNAQINYQYWAKSLEKCYHKSPLNMPDKLKKSYCFCVIANEYEKENKKKAPSNKSFYRWWKKYYPKRFKK